MYKEDIRALIDFINGSKIHSANAAHGTKLKPPDFRQVFSEIMGYEYSYILHIRLSPDKASIISKLQSAEKQAGRRTVASTTGIEFSRMEPWLQYLDARCQRVLTCIYKNGMSRKDIAATEDLTTERVRQLRNNALGQIALAMFRSAATKLH